MTKLPNLELLMYLAKLYLEYDEEYVQKSKGQQLNFTIETFPQMWGSTCTGFDITEDGKATFGGSAMTTEYTTVVTEERTKTYVIFFGDRVCYAVHKPKSKFYDDWEKRNMASLSEAKKRY